MLDFKLGASFLETQRWKETHTDHLESNTTLYQSLEIYQWLENLTIWQDTLESSLMNIYKVYLK